MLNQDIFLCMDTIHKCLKLLFIPLYGADTAHLRLIIHAKNNFLQLKNVNEHKIELQ